MADDLDPFEATLRAGLAGLRAAPDALMTERRLGLVTRLGRRRRQRRRVAGGMAVVGAVLLLFVASALGRVDGATDQRVQLGGTARRDNVSTERAGPVVVDGGSAPTSPATTVPTTAAVGGAGSGSPTGTSPSTTARPAAIGPSAPATPNGPTTTLLRDWFFKEENFRYPVPDDCVYSDSTGGKPVHLIVPPIRPNLTFRPQCFRVSHGTDLRFLIDDLYPVITGGDPDFGVEIMSYVTPGGGGPPFAIPQGVVTTYGPVDQRLYGGVWTRFDIFAMDRGRTESRHYPGEFFLLPV